MAGFESRDIRAYQNDVLEVRELGGEPVIEGHAAVFERATDLGGIKEKVASGAFARTLQKDDVRALFNHNVDYVLGRNKAGTLELSEDDKGLKYRIKPPNTSWARDLMESIRRGDITQSSFGFVPIKDEWDESGKVPTRTLVEVKLYDVSPVTFPAYPQTDVGLRSILLEHKIDLPAWARVLLKLKAQIPLTDVESKMASDVRDMLIALPQGMQEVPEQGIVTQCANIPELLKEKLRLAELE